MEEGLTERTKISSRGGGGGVKGGEGRDLGSA